MWLLRDAGQPSQPGSDQQQRGAGATGCVLRAVLGRRGGQSRPPVTCYRLGAPRRPPSHLSATQARAAVAGSAWSRRCGGTAHLSDGRAVQSALATIIGTSGNSSSGNTRCSDRGACLTAAQSNWPSSGTVRRFAQLWARQLSEGASVRTGNGKARLRRGRARQPAPSSTLPVTESASCGRLASSRPGVAACGSAFRRIPSGGRVILARVPRPLCPNLAAPGASGHTAGGPRRRLPEVGLSDRPWRPRPPAAPRLGVLESSAPTHF